MRFDLLVGVGVGDGVGEAFFRFEEAVGDGVGVFAEVFRCLRVGRGVGVGARILLIFVPNDSSAASEALMAANDIANARKY